MVMSDGVYRAATITLRTPSIQCFRHGQSWVSKERNRLTIGIANPKKIVVKVMTTFILCPLETFFHCA